MSQGRILVYNGATGEGKIILTTAEKISFNVESWGSIDAVPEIGMKVQISDKGIISVINNKSSDKPPVANNTDITINSNSTQEKSTEILNIKKDEFIHRQVSQGYCVSSDNSSGFVLEKTIHRIDLFLLILVGGTISSLLLMVILSSLFVGIYGFAIAVIMSIFVLFIGKQERITGKLFKDYLQVTFSNGTSKIIWTSETTSISDEVARNLQHISVFDLTIEQQRSLMKQLGISFSGNIYFYQENTYSTLEEAINQGLKDAAKRKESTIQASRTA